MSESRASCRQNEPTLENPKHAKLQQSSKSVKSINIAFLAIHRYKPLIEHFIPVHIHYFILKFIEYVWELFGLKVGKMLIHKISHV